MARRARSAGDLAQFQGTGQVAGDLPRMPVDDGSDWTKVASVFAGLSNQLGSLADAAALREGQAEGLEKGMKASLPNAGGEPVPLALRRDGTISGEASDKAAIATFAQRLDIGLRSEIAAAHDSLKGDPAALIGRLNEIQATYDADINAGSDPRLRAALQMRFEQATATYKLDAAWQRERALIQERNTTTRTALAGQRQDIERQAYILGANPAGDKLLAQQVEQGDREVDAAAAEGVITPAEQVEEKARRRTAALTAKVRGAFDAIEDPAAQERFAAKLSEDWENKKGAISVLDKDTADTLAGELMTTARRRQAERQAETGISRADLARKLDQDVANLRATGQPMAFDGGPLQPADVARVLGADRAAEWAVARNQARKVYAATADFGSMSAEAIAGRLAGLDDGRNPELAAEVRAEAERVLDARRRDPAGAVDGAFNQVQAAKLALNPENPATYQALADARVNAQEAVGVPDLARQPLTEAEARALVGPVLAAAPDQRVKVLQGVLTDVERRYGPHADAVTAQLLHQAGVDSGSATASAGLLRRIGAGGRPSAADARAVDVATETRMAEQAFLVGRLGSDPVLDSVDPAPQAGAIAAPQTQSPGAAPAKPKALPPPRPSSRALEMLRQRPDLAPKFDEMFGAGQAEYYRGIMSNVPAAAGRTTINPDGSENWEP